MKLNNRFIAYIFLVILIGSGVFSSCRDDRFTTDPNHMLSFSTDSLRFDTVFSTVSSATKRIMVYNKNKDAIRISHISLQHGANSVFQINVNGSNNPNHQFTNIEINGKDSMYIFVAVKVNELGVNTPVYIEEALNFETNGNKQNIILNTTGQNVEFLRGKTIYNDTILTGIKPYLIYDSLIVAPGKTLKLEAGCKLYFHSKAHIKVFGTLQAEGERGNPIIMRGDRFDQINQQSPIPYNDIAGQWDGIYLMGNSGKHVLKHVNMNSGSVGLYIKNTDRDIIPSPNNIPTVEIINCKIHNFLYYGLYVQNSNLTVINSVISNTGDYTIYLNGGKHTFVHTTIANYFNNGKNSIQAISRPQGQESKPSMMIINLNKSVPMETTFLNSVVMGSIETEFSLATRFPEQYNGSFKDSYIRRATPYELPQFEKIRWYQAEDVVFKNTYLNHESETGKGFNFMPDSISPLRKLGNAALINNPEYSSYVYEDLNGTIRPTETSPDAGAYQWVPTE